MLKKLLVCIPLVLMGCIRVPEGVTVIEKFELERYLGTWYEIARIENSFEKDFTSVTATYTLDQDGTVAVLNRGYDAEEGVWKESRGKAKFVDDPAKGALKVSFFGPFYSSYNIIGLDREGYEWAIVCGYKKSLFWILARKPVMEPGLLEELLEKADSMGFETEGLVFNTPPDNEDA